MEVVETCEELIRARHELAVAHHNKHFERPLIGLTPTMGALHQGHRALIERMSQECDVGVVTIFVNPLQFRPGEDLTRYPRTLDDDLRLCAAARAHLVFAPPVEEVYPDGFATRIGVTGLTARWCGESRPGHFDGVTTVVGKLFCLCSPDRAYFGEKDYQQLRVIERMAADLNMAVEVVRCKTVREADGLACSSRNQYLSLEEREVAPRIYHALMRIAVTFTGGVRDVESLLVEGRHEFSRAEGPAIKLEYLAVVDPLTLEPREQAQRGDRVLIAAHIGATRLIDNIELTGTEVLA